ncbi:DUF167 domain-containing protein [Thermotoga caldifontis]|uniref:DUF167 domain-containing protein n=1 Tax=Thermotoga caldifontis TaxID=1508419 RepID=UPI0018D39FB7|nr:DUF167 domain-containing protein [Thermotoga caldifontis]
MIKLVRILVKVKPGAKSESIELMADGTLKVSVTAPAVEGKANEAVRELLAEKFSLSKSDVRIVNGRTSRFKQIDLPLDTEEIRRRLGIHQDGV